MCIKNRNESIPTSEISTKFYPKESSGNFRRRKSESYCVHFGEKVNVCDYVREKGNMRVRKESEREKK